MEKNKLIVRRMMAADVPAVALMERDAFSTPWSERSFLDALRQENTIFLVAENETGPVGYVGLYCAVDEGEITNVAVKREFRCRGIADMIISELLHRAAARGVTKIYLEVRASNLPAQKLYEKYGFIKQGIRRNFYRAPREDAFVMARQPEIPTVENDSETLQ